MTARTAAGTWVETWSFKFTGRDRCGLPTPNGGAYPPGGAAMLVWEAPGACTAAQAAADVAANSGRAVAALWSLDGAGQWRYYVPAASAGTLGDLPALAALVAVLG